MTHYIDFINSLLLPLIMNILSFIIIEYLKKIPPDIWRNMVTLKY